MLPVSEAFLATIRDPHTAVVTALLVDPPGQFGVNPTGRALKITEEGGSVKLDADADIRATLDLTVAERWPDTLDAVNLTPYGAEVFITRGVELGNGQIQRAPLGYFQLSNVAQPDAPDGPLRLTGEDRMVGIIRARFEKPAQFLATATYGQVVDTLVTDVYPGAVIEWDDATGAEAIGRSVTEEEDRYKLLLDVVTSTGKIMFFDYRGVLVIKDVPDPGASVWSVDAGEGGVLVTLSRELDREAVYNAVISRGEALDDTPPVQGAAYDLDPSSPTYWEGPFGKVPRFYSSPLLTTAAQCDETAASLLAQSKGLPYIVDFTALPNPALEPFDPVQVVYPVDLTRVPHRRREMHVLVQITIPLSADGDMPANTRKVTL